MDEVSQQRFDALRKTDPADWTDADREFMQARRSYLNEEEVQHLNLDSSSEPASGAAVAPGPKRGKKSE